MAFRIEVAKSTNYLWNGTASNDVIMKASTANARIHIGPSTTSAPLVLSSNTLSIPICQASNVVASNVTTSTMNVTNIHINGRTMTEATQWSSLQSTNSLYILNSNVGIGKSNPQYILDVNGTINAGTVYVNGAPLSTSQWSNTSSNVYIVSSNVGIGTSTPSEALEVNGNILSTGNIVPSDSNLKHDFVNIPQCLQALVTLAPYTFKYRDDPAQKIHAGFIAQQVEHLIPHLVTTTPFGHKTLSYQEMIPYLLQCIKELNDRVTELETK